jgi:hypothetical protein
MKALMDIRANDGSRQFASLPATRDWYAVRDHAQSLAGATLTRFLCDGVTEAWIDFAFDGESFTINDQSGEYWFFVQNPACAERTLRAVRGHWETLLGEGA